MTRVTKARKTATVTLTSEEWAAHDRRRDEERVAAEQRLLEERAAERRANPAPNIRALRDFGEVAFGPSWTQTVAEMLDLRSRSFVEMIVLPRSRTAQVDFDWIAGLLLQQMADRLQVMVCTLDYIVKSSPMKPYEYNEHPCKYRRYLEKLQDFRPLQREGSAIVVVEDPGYLLELAEYRSPNREPVPYSRSPYLIDGVELDDY